MFRLSLFVISPNAQGLTHRLLFRLKVIVSFFACLSSIPSNSKVVMLLRQLERMNGDLMARDVKNARQVTAKILHLIQTQGERTHTHREHNHVAASLGVARQ